MALFTVPSSYVGLLLLSHFSDEETKAQSHCVPCPKAQLLSGSSGIQVQKARLSTTPSSKNCHPSQYNGLTAPIKVYVDIESAGARKEGTKYYNAFSEREVLLSGF